MLKSYSNKQSYRFVSKDINKGLRLKKIEGNDFRFQMIFIKSANWFKIEIVESAKSKKSLQIMIMERIMANAIRELECTNLKNVYIK